MPERAFSADRPLPEGVRDLLFADAAAWREMESALRRTWSAWGYREIILPTFEYADTLATDVGAAIDAEMYRFFDRHGRTLALRPDLTIPTARVVATRLYDQPMPLRIAYAGSVFRHEPPRAGRQHEFTQVGVELIGAHGSAADAESIALAVFALRAAGLPRFRVTIGHIGYFRGLLQALDLSERTADELRDAVDRKAEGEIRALFQRTAGAPAPAVEALQALVGMTGDAAMLRRARAHVQNGTMAAALDELDAVAVLLQAYDVAGEVTYDLAEVRDLDYYTGVTFEGFAPGLGFNVISGGRYDDLLGHFGPPLPAVGWALALDRVLEARELQQAAAVERPPDVLADAGVAWVSWARAAGLAVELCLLSVTGEALWEQAQLRGISRAVSGGDGGELVVYEASGRRAIRADDLQEVARWRQE